MIMDLTMLQMKQKGVISYSAFVLPPARECSGIGLDLDLALKLIGAQVSLTTERGHLIICLNVSLLLFLPSPSDRRLQTEGSLYFWRRGKTAFAWWLTPIAAMYIVMGYANSQNDMVNSKEGCVLRLKTGGFGSFSSSSSSNRKSKGYAP